MKFPQSFENLVGIFISSLAQFQTLLQDAKLVTMHLINIKITYFDPEIWQINAYALHILFILKTVWDVIAHTFHFEMAPMIELFFTNSII